MVDFVYSIALELGNVLYCVECTRGLVVVNQRYLRSFFGCESGQRAYIMW
jgi:hypothetical protein